MVLIKSSFIQNSYDRSLALLYKTRETGAYCTEQHLNGSVFFCYTRQEISMAVFHYLLIGLSSQTMFVVVMNQLNQPTASTEIS